MCDESNQVRVTVPVEPAGRVAISQKEHLYYKGAVRAEAERLAGFLRGILDGQVEKVFILSRRGAVWIVTPLNLRAEKLTPALSTDLQQSIRDMSAQVFQDAPVQIELLDSSYQPKRLLTASGEQAP
jgi:hypothetical protein